MKVYCDTNKGLLRENNEDNYLVMDTKDFSLYAVADGMGGHSAGEVASMIALTVIKDSFDEALKDQSFKIPKFINESIQLANIKIREEANQNEEYAGMGTTVTMAVIDLSFKTAYVGNIGDSRTYIIKNKEIIQITEDHTYVHELFRQGKISQEEAKTHPKRNVITRAVGSEETMQTDIFEIDLEENDILLLCSDGLTTHLSDEKIFSTIKEYGCEKSVEKLIELANENGGTDNITLIIVDTN